MTQLHNCLIVQRISWALPLVAIANSQIACLEMLHGVAIRLLGNTIVFELYGDSC